MNPAPAPRRVLLRPFATRWAAGLACLTLAVASPAEDVASPAEETASFFPQGVATAEVTATSAIVWTRTAEPARLIFELWAAPEDGASTGRGNGDAMRRLEVQTTAERQSIVHIGLGGLEPATDYGYRFVRLDGDATEPSTPEAESFAEGAFRSAPTADSDVLVSMIVGGDLGGQTYCRHRERGYDIFSAMTALRPDFFVANGDMIYADNPCPAQGPKSPDGTSWPNLPGDFPGITDVEWTDAAALEEAYGGHWSYNRADPHHRAFLAQVPYYVQWDDHEVVNDFGAAWPAYPAMPDRAGYGEMVAAGHHALLLWNPLGPWTGGGIEALGPTPSDSKIYRSFRWGRHLELFLLDGRSYRSPNELSDTAYNAKVLLGDAQRQWLVEGLKASDATWKVVSSDVPLSIPTGWPAALYGRDGFANGTSNDSSQRTGFERELLALLTELDRADVENVVFVVTDVHLAAHLRYAPDLDGDGDRLLFHELVNGPLSAITLPTLPQLDPTLGPSILFSEGSLLNFSYLRLVRGEGGRMHLVADIRDRQGEPRFGSRLELRPR